MLENDNVELIESYNEDNRIINKIIPNEKFQDSIASTKKSCRKSLKHTFKGTIKLIIILKIIFILFYY